MSECVSHRTNVKARKDHKCFGCYGIIVKGTVVANVTTCVEDGDIYTVRLCDECEVTALEFQKRGDEWYEGDLGEDRKEQKEKEQRQADHVVDLYIERKGW